ncbi:phage tail protein [Streptomyces cinereoruber]|uniref:phage tail protein n=1 Tax=Streptomyces cinereoruber TaxID=67260 RepID=UPI0033985B66
MTALTIGELVGFIRADGSDFERNLARSQLRMEGFRLDVNGRLRDLRGRFVRDTAIMGRAVADSFSEAEQAGTRITTVYSSVADAQSRTFRARMERMQGVAAQFADRVGSAFGRVQAAWGRIDFARMGDRLRPAAQGFLSVATSIGMMGAKLGIAAPAAAGLAATVGAIAPAAAVAVSGFIALKLATTAFKIGMVGVGDAVKAAMDPSDPEAFNEALKKLSPNAKAFALQVRALQPELKKVQQAVQDAMFEGLDGILRDMGKTTLPVLRNGLADAGGALNNMARGVGNAAIGLAKNGTLGKALRGATDGLWNLSRVPGQLVVGLTQIGAAAAPVFGKLTKAAGGALDRLSEKMTKAFWSGGMQRAIEAAIDLLGDLFEVLGNVGSIFVSVFKAAQVSGGGMLGVLKEITGQMAAAFKSPEVQAGLKSIFSVMAQLAKSVGPILVSLLKTVASTFAVLGPPIRELVRHLGDGLLKIAVALGPVVVELGRAFGLLVMAALPLVDLAADLIAGILPILTPLFKALGDIIRAATPFVAALAKAAGDLLLPILNALATQVLPKLLPPFVDMANRIFPLLADVLIQLTPSLTELGLALADLLVELTPLIVKALELGVVLFDKLMPYIAPLIALLIRLASGGLQALAGTITRYVIPAVRAVAALLSGDFSGALGHAKVLVRNFGEDLARNFASMRTRASSSLSGLAQAARTRATEAGQGLISGVRGRITETVGLFRDLPSRIRGAMSGAGGMLVSIGRSILQGLINGIRAKIGELRSTLGGITASLPSWKGPPETDARILTPAGRSVIEGFQRGIAAQVPALRQQLQGLTAGLPGMGFGTSPMGLHTGAGAAAAQPIVIELHGDGLKDTITRIVKNQGRGSVQLAFGTD